MTKFTLNTASLLLMVLFSTSSIAASPWAEEEAAATTQNEAEPDPISQPEDSRPAAMDEAPADPVAEEQAVTDTEQTVEVIQQQGDVLATPQDAPQAVGVRILDFPRRGMTTDKVQNELGRPGEIIPAVGQPPISRWVYDDRIVYFERSSVIHVVAK